MIYDLNAQFVENLDKTLVETFVRTDALTERHIDDLVIAYTHHNVSLALFDGLCFFGVN